MVQAEERSNASEVLRVAIWVQADSQQVCGRADGS